MKITKLSLHHFRGMNDVTLECDPSLNVFVGENGAGKSAVLDALALLLSWWVNRLRSQGSAGRHISATDISNGEAAAVLEVWAQTADTSLHWRLAKGRTGRSSTTPASDLRQLNSDIKTRQQAITDSDGHTNLPLLVYYPVHRVVHDIPLRIRKKHHFDLLAAYDDALTSGSNFRLFFEWFREREDLENETIRRASPLFDNPPAEPLSPADLEDPQLRAVRRALGEFLPHFSNLTVRRKPLRMEVSKDGQVLRFDQLSDGEKCFIALISDLARRLALANPTQDPLQGVGVVLIDELDLHLHPQWQRLLLPRLTEVFPNCQFFVSTHSPHVLSHVRADKVFVLERDQQHHVQVRQPASSYGHSAERILEDIMGLTTTRPEAVENRLQAVFDSIEKGEFEQARQRIDALQDDLGQDPDLLRATMLLRRKEVIGR